MSLLRRFSPVPVGELARFASAILPLLGLAMATALPFSLRAQEAAPTPAQDTPQTSDAKVVRISGGVSAANRLSKVDPVYPQAAKDAHVSGTVVLAALIGPDGAVQDLSVVSGPPELTQAALDAVKQWTYKPFFLNGEAVTVSTIVTVNFQLAS